MSCILPFPKRNDPSTTQEFLPGKPVLAVYPGTTALYKATVISTPRKVSCVVVSTPFQSRFIKKLTSKYSKPACCISGSRGSLTSKFLHTFAHIHHKLI